MSERDIVKQIRKRLANNGRNPANNNAGIRVGSDLHLCEMLLAEYDSRTALLLEQRAAANTRVTALEVLLYRVERHGDASGDAELMADIRAALPEGGWTDQEKQG